MGLFDKEKQVDNDAIMKMAMRDTGKACVIAMPVTIAMELGMIVMWIVRTFVQGQQPIAYLVSYIVLLVIVSSVLGLDAVWRKNVEANYNKMNVLQSVNALLMVVWAVVFTNIEALNHDSFDILLFVTFITIIPTFSFLKPSFWIPVQILADAYIIVLGVRYRPHALSFITNFLIFAIMAGIATTVFFNIRKKAYLKQNQLAQLSDLRYQNAYIDELTGLLNRRAYSEKLDEFERSGMPSDVIMIMADLNLLKKTNDQFGHLAGDELLKAGAKILQDEFADKSTIYRIGGDEYFVCTTLPEDEVLQRISNVKKSCRTWKGNYPSKLALSIGMVKDSDAPTVHEKIILVDLRMYEDKREFYKEEGIDRRNR